MTELTRAEELAIIEPIVGSTEVAERVIDALSMSQPKYQGASEPGAWLSRDLLLRAVDLRAIAWNALCAVPAAGGSWDRFWRKLHNLREAVNRPEHEDIRIAYAGTFEPGPATTRDTSRVIDERWRVVPREAESHGESPRP